MKFKKTTRLFSAFLPSISISSFFIVPHATPKSVALSTRSISIKFPPQPPRHTRTSHKIEVSPSNQSPRSLFPPPLPLNKMRTYVTLIIFLSILLVIFTNYASITYYSSLPSLNPSLNSLQTVPQISTESKKSSTLLTVSNPNLSTVTYTISLTSCSSSPTLKHDSSLIGLIDGSLILRHSILTHSPTPPNFIAFVHTTAKDTPCHLELERGGWECKVVDTPLKVSDIKTDNIRRNIEKNGCCGDKVRVRTAWGAPF